MKFFLVLFVVALGAWFLFRRGARRVPPPGQPKQPAAQAETPAMLTCAHCGVHLPPADAVRGADQTYCSEAHRLAGPRTQ